MLMDELLKKLANWKLKSSLDIKIKKNLIKIDQEMPKLSSYCDKDFNFLNFLDVEFTEVDSRIETNKKIIQKIKSEIREFSQQNQITGGDTSISSDNGHDGVSCALEHLSFITLDLVFFILCCLFIYRFWILKKKSKTFHQIV